MPVISLSKGTARMRPARRAVSASCLIGASLVLVAACSSGGGGTTAKTRPPTPVSTAARVKGVQVNLMMTGDRTAVIVGTAGTCTIPAFGAPTYMFQGTDYPTLTPGGSLNVSGPIVAENGGRVAPSLKVLMGDVGLLTPQDGTGITVSANKRLVTLDADLSGGVGVSADNSILDPANSLHAHISGTIRCS